MAHYIFANAPRQRGYWAIYTTFSSSLHALSFPALKRAGLDAHSGQRERRYRKNDRFPKLLTHGDCPYVVLLRRLWTPARTRQFSASAIRCQWDPTPPAWGMGNA